MMSFNIKRDLHHGVLIAALIVIVQDLSSRGGAQAWTYNYSSPNQRWLEAHQWCQKHFTNMVAIQNQEETEFLNNLLPFNRKYYWIGIHKVAGVWTCADTNKKVPEEAQNWATAEPDNIAGQDCVEIYIKREKDTAKWNNEKCHNKKGVICYSASCTQESCSAHADCMETVGNYTCMCHPGFLGAHCKEAIKCKPLPDLEQGSHHCFHPYGSNRFNSSCVFLCELGFRLVGTPQLLCQASGLWSHPVPQCQVEQCPVLNLTDFSGGSMNCSHPITPYSYNSTCEFRCDEGYELTGQDQIQCDHTGQWTASVPTCTVRKCSPISVPFTGSMTCVDTIEVFSFGSQCNFTCQEGYFLTGDNTLTCLASGEWSKSTPTCTVVQCSSLKTALHSIMQCQHPIREHSYGSICITQCEEGFDLIGTNQTKCSSQGNWSHTLPLCQAKRCNPFIPPPHGSLSCSDPNGFFSFGSRCTKSCDEGFLLNGTSSTECTSRGVWSVDIPSCFAKECPTLNSTPHGSLTCSDPHGEFSFGSRCMTTCEEGFLLNGTADTECTSQGTWSTNLPHCLAKRCPPLKPLHAILLCSDPHGEFSFGSRCTTTCEEGFVLNGMADTECTSLSTWSTDIPHCLAKKCPTLISPPHGAILCSDPHGEFSFGSRCMTTCEEGFLLNGTADTECTSQGTWSTNLPHCLAKRCPPLKPLLHAILLCSDPHGEFSFGSRCTTTCEEGFVLNGMADTECTSLSTWSTDIPHCLAKKCPTLISPPHGAILCSDPHGAFSFGSSCLTTCEEGFVVNGTAHTECTSLSTWNTNVPQCLARQCPLLAEAPQHGRINCSHTHIPFTYGSHCDFECSEGFWLRGTSTMTCNSSGHWSQDLPSCQPVQCEAISTLSLPLSMNCSHPLGNFSFGSQCVFTCEEGFSLNGTAALLCSSSGFWIDSQPTCTGMSVETGMLMNFGVGAASVVGILGLLGLTLLIIIYFKKKGNRIMSDVPAWGERENPAFEF